MIAHLTRLRKQRHLLFAKQFCFPYRKVEVVNEINNDSFEPCDYDHPKWPDGQTVEVNDPSPLEFDFEEKLKDGKHVHVDVL